MCDANRVRILVTCFEPFGGDAENGSSLAVQELAGRWSDPQVELITEVMPVAFERGARALADAMRRHQPDALICVGENGTIGHVNVETQGRNLISARIADNDGAQPDGQPVDGSPNAPEARPASFDPTRARDVLRSAGVDAELSDDAGLFVCNTFAYLAPSFGVPAGFLHVPALRSAGTATVGAETDPRAAEAQRRGPVVSRHSVADIARGLAAVVAEVAASLTGPVNGRPGDMPSGADAGSAV